MRAKNERRNSGLVKICDFCFKLTPQMKNLNTHWGGYWLVGNFSSSANLTVL
jgi:hypothetical protein